MIYLNKLNQGLYHHLQNQQIIKNTKNTKTIIITIGDYKTATRNDKNPAITRYRRINGQVTVKTIKPHFLHYMEIIHRNCTLESPHTYALSRSLPAQTVAQSTAPTRGNAWIRHCFYFCPSTSQLV